MSASFCFQSAAFHLDCGIMRSTSINWRKRKERPTYIRSPAQIFLSYRKHLVHVPLAPSESGDTEACMFSASLKEILRAWSCSSTVTR